MNPSQNNPDTPTPDTTLSNAPQPSVDPAATPVVAPPTSESPATAEVVVDAPQVSAAAEMPAAPSDPTLTTNEPSVPEPTAPVVTSSQSAFPDQQPSGAFQAGSAESTAPASSSVQPEVSQTQEVATEHDHGKSFGVIGFVLIAVGVLIGGLVAFILISNNA